MSLLDPLIGPTPVTPSPPGRRGLVWRILRLFAVVAVVAPHVAAVVPYHLLHGDAATCDRLRVESVERTLLKVVDARVRIIISC